MGHRIVRQSRDPELYLLYSTITERVFAHNMTRDQVVDYYAQLAAKEARERVSKQLSGLQGKVYEGEISEWHDSEDPVRIRAVERVLRGEKVSWEEL